MSVTAQPVTMAEVARRAGVSRTTVSFVLNDRPGVSISADTRERIHEVARTLGYRPNAGARSLARRRSDWYGLVTEIVTAPFAVDVIAGAQDTASAEGRFLLIASSQEEASDPAHQASVEAAAIEKLLEQRVAGLLYAATWHRAVEVPDLVREVPTVLINCFDPHGELPAVVPDEFAGGRRATRHLIAAGHRRIGLINLDPGVPASIGRHHGYRAALAEAGLTAADDLVVDGYGDAGSGYRAAGELLDLAEPPTAIFCGNDRTAMGAYDAIKERGLRVGEDVSVVGFDNQEVIAAWLRPRLTTLALPFRSMGDQGVRTLRALTEGRAVVHREQRVDCPLLVRDSVRPPR